MAKKIIILGAGMMGSALAFPAAENGNEVHIVGTCLDDAIIDGYIATRKHEKFCRPFPENVQFHYFKDWKKVAEGADFMIGGVSSFGVDWFLEEILMQLKGLKRLWTGHCIKGLTGSGPMVEQLRQALPDTLVVAEGEPTQNGWRDDPHYAVIQEMFQKGAYIPFAESPPLEEE